MYFSKWTDVIFLRERLSLSFGWRFAGSFRPEYTRPDFKDNGLKLVDVPHTIADCPRSYINEHDFQAVTCYRKMFILPESMAGRRLILHFDGVTGCAAVFVNGKPVCAHRGGFTPFCCEIGELIKKGDNLITVAVDSTERSDTAPYGKFNSQLFYGGIYRDVWLEAVDDVYVQDCFVSTSVSGDSFTVTAVGQINGANKCGMTFYLYDEEKKISAKYFNCDDSHFTFDWKLPCQVTPWTPEQPKLYSLHVSLESGDESRHVIGFRSCEFKHDGFFLNGKRIKLIGTGRTEDFPGCGNALPAEGHELDARLIRSLGFNVVRTMQTPPSESFLDECDRVGLLVIEELPGWHEPGSDDQWRESCLDTLSEMIIRDRTHPCIISYGTRAEGSLDNEFFAQCAAKARELDPTRQITGSHSFGGGAFDEDILLFSDFDFAENTPLEKRKSLIRTKPPYMVNLGFSQSFALRETDGVQSQLDVALRHASALDAVLAENEISGAFFGSICDYHVHQQLGDGDGLSLFGLCDNARAPKLTADFYESQQSERPVLRLSAAPYGAAFPGVTPGNELYLFTNCDSVKVYRAATRIAILKPSGKRFAHLKHPPIPVDDLLCDLLVLQEGIDARENESLKNLLLAIARAGENITADLRSRINTAAARNKTTPEAIIALCEKYITGWQYDAAYTFKGIIDGKTVCTLTVEPVSEKKLLIEPSRTTLHQSTTYDVVKVDLKAVDQNGNVLTECADAVSIETDGSIDIIGSRLLSLRAGRSSFYVRTKGGKGAAKLRITTESLGKYSVDLTVARD